MSTACSAFTWALYDHLITLDDEIAFVWKRQIRSSAILFIIVRYLSLIVLGAPVAILAYSFSVTDIEIQDPLEFNVGETIWETLIFVRVPQLAVFWTVEVILQTRIYAVYGSRRLAAFNAMIFILEIIFMILLSVYFSIPTSDGFGARPMYIIPGLVFELWLAGLAAAKLKARTRSWELITVVVTDSIIYFFLIAVTMLLYFIMGNLPLTEPTEYADIDLEALVWPFMVASQSIGASRLFLHLRKEYYRQHESTSGIHGASLVAFRGGSVLRPQQRGFMSSLVDEAFYEPNPEAPNNEIELGSTTFERVPGARETRADAHISVSKS